VGDVLTTKQLCDDLSYLQRADPSAPGLLGAAVRIRKHDEALRAEVEALRKRAEGKDRIIRGQVKAMEDLRALCGLDSDLGTWEARCRRAEVERDAAVKRAEEAEAAIMGYVQTTGDPCPVCGWRGVRGDDGCAFCAQEDARRAHAVAVDVLREVMEALKLGKLPVALLARADAVLAGQAAPCGGTTEINECADLRATQLCANEASNALARMRGDLAAAEQAVREVLSGLEVALTPPDEAVEEG